MPDHFVVYATLIRRQSKASSADDRNNLIETGTGNASIKVSSGPECPVRRCKSILLTSIVSVETGVLYAATVMQIPSDC